MNRLKRIAGAMAVITTLISVTAMATWSQAINLVAIDVDATATGNGTSTFLTVSASPTGKPTCTPTTSPYLELWGTPDHLKSMTTMATAAFLANKMVKVSFDGTCDGVYPKVTSLLIQ